MTQDLTTISALARAGVVPMRTFYSNDLHGRWVGAAAVVKAKDRNSARRKIRAILKKNNLAQDDRSWKMHELVEGPAVLLCDGDY